VTKPKRGRPRSVASKSKADAAVIDGVLTGAHGQASIVSVSPPSPSTSPAPSLESELPAEIAASIEMVSVPDVDAVVEVVATKPKARRGRPPKVRVLAIET
jgi:hypothetical protein